MSPRLRARRRPLWTLAIALLLLVSVAALLAWRARPQLYVAGEGAAGLTDTLGRELPADHPRVVFADVAAEAGLVFQHAPFQRTNRLPEDMGSGVALADVDGDGWTDVFLPNFAHSLQADAAAGAGAGARCALFRNRGDGSFEDASASAGLDLELLANGAAFLDSDSDGDLDLLVASYGELTLLSNDGRGHFQDVTAGSGLAGLRGFWTSVGVGDYDRDGALDAYVCGYVRWKDETGGAGKLARQYDAEIPSGINPSAFPPERNLLLHNRGDGSFVECAVAAGVENLSGRSLGVSFADLSGDGWPDLYVANDVSDNAFFVNRHDGTFADESAPALVADYRGAMGLAVADFDGDGDLDFHVTHWVGQENALYVNVSRASERLRFLDEADRYGLGASTLPEVGWATGFFDFDNDGVLDLFAINGSTIPLAAERTQLQPQRSQLFWNRGEKRGFFSLGASAGGFWGEELVGRGGALCDYDQDGDQDLVVQIHGGRARLLRNDGGDAHPSVCVRLRQPSGNRFAIGAKLELVAGGRTQFAEFETQGSYLSQHAVGEQSFGLGSATQAELLRVTWPDGTREESGPFPGRSRVTWMRGSEPVVERLPGHRASADEQRRFYAVLEDAGRRRLAGEFTAAEALYREALVLWPGHTDALYYLANCLWEEQRVPEALAVLDGLVRAHPNESRAWMQIGTISLLREGRSPSDLARAGQAFSESHRINGEESLPVVRMGVVAFLCGDLEQADKHFADALALNAASVEAAWYRGALAWKRGDAAQAGEWLAKAREFAKKKQIVAQPTLHEGGTKSGAAMVSSTPAHGDAVILRWSSTAERTGGADEEYGPR